MKPCLNCGKDWDSRNCPHCGLSLRLWVKSGLGHNPSELEMEDFLAREYAALCKRCGMGIDHDKEGNCGVCAKWTDEEVKRATSCT